MLARALIVALLAVAGVGVIVGEIASSGRADAATVIACAVGAILATCAFVVAVTYGISRAKASPVPPTHRADGIARVAAIFREFLAHVVVFAFLAPFERVWTRDPVADPGAGADSPVVLVHGYLLNGAAWRRFVRFLASEGARAYVATVEPPLASIDAMADSLARRIEEVCAATGSSQVRLVAHSMGGVVCRAYLRAHGAARVARLVTIASPHHGTAIAWLGIGQAARDMLPGNAWLAALAEWEEESEHPPTVALFTYYDNYIAPQESSMLSWAENEVLPVHGHVEMYFSRRVARQVSRALGLEPIGSRAA